MLEAERKQLNKINKELMIANGEYADLRKRLNRIGRMIFYRKKKIDELLDKE